MVEEPRYEEKPISRPNNSASTKLERAASMWDLLHPNEELRGQKTTNPYKYRRPLPEIKRSNTQDQVWQTAPYANDFQMDPSLARQPFYKQMNIE